MLSLILTSLEKKLEGGSHAWTGKNTPLPPEAKFSPPAGIFGAAHLWPQLEELDETHFLPPTTFL